MTSSSPERTNQAEDPQPQGEEYVYTEDVLAFVRDQAARRDRALAHHYANMSAGRIKDGVEVAQRLLEAHRELVGRQGRGARTGRRKHTQQVSALLASTNKANLVLAQAFLYAAYGVLPPSQPQHNG